MTKTDDGGPTALNIAAGVLGFAAEFASREETRYYLNGVYVEPAREGVVAVATDGHRLISINDPAGFISRPAILAASKSAFARFRSKHAARLVAADIGKTEVARPIVATLNPEKGATESVLLDEIDGTFPEWRKVFPTDFSWSGIMPPFQGRYLSAFDGLARVGGHHGGVRVIARGEGEPAVVIPAGGSAWPWVGVVMPIRGDKIPKSYPAWLGLSSKRVRVKASAIQEAA